MGKALTRQLQLVTNWNVFPLQNAYSSKSRSFTRIGWFWRSCCKMQAILPLPSRPLTAAARAALRFQLPAFLAACQEKQRGTRGEVRQLHGCGVRYPLPVSIPPWQPASAPGNSAPPIPQDARSQTPPKKNLRQPQNQTKIKSVWIYLSLQSNASNGKAWK